MIDPEMLKLVAPMGIGGVLALVMFFVYRKDMMSIINELKNLVSSHEGDKKILIDTIKENSVNTNTNTIVLQSLHRRLDKEERDREIREGNGK